MLRKEFEQLLYPGFDRDLNPEELQLQFLAHPELVQHAPIQWINLLSSSHSALNHFLKPGSKYSVMIQSHQMLPEPGQGTRSPDRGWPGGQILSLQNHLFGLPIKFFGYPFDAEDVRPYQGWALCVRSGFSEKQFQEDFRVCFARRFCRAVLGDWFVQEYAESQPEVWNEFIGLQTKVAPSDVKGSIASETAAFKELDAFVSKSDDVGTKAELKAKFGQSLGERAFERVWDRLRVQHPRLSIPGRRKKS